MAYSEAIQVPGAGCGPFVGGPARGVLHTTEGASAEGAFGAFRANGDWPHFTVTIEGGRFVVYQHLPINVGACSLEHRSGTVETNRQSAIQIEIVGAAASSPAFPQAYLAGLAKLMRWIEASANVKPISTVAWHPYPSSGGDNNGVRLSDAAWAAYNGWCGHMHVPHQEHGDPGAIDIHALLLGATPAPPLPASTVTPAHVEPVEHTGGDVHFVISHGAVTLQAYDHNGAKLFEIPALTVGANGGRYVVGGDTPWGTYTLGRPQYTAKSESAETWAEYGSAFLPLTPVKIINGRIPEGAGIHNGRSQTTLMCTMGCVRVFDAALLQKICPLVTATLNAGGQVHVTVGA